MDFCDLRTTSTEYNLWLWQSLNRRMAKKRRMFGLGYWTKFMQSVWRNLLHAILCHKHRVIDFWDQQSDEHLKAIKSFCVGGNKKIWWKIWVSLWKHFKCLFCKQFPLEPHNSTHLLLFQNIGTFNEQSSNLHWNLITVKAELFLHFIST